MRKSCEELGITHSSRVPASSGVKLENYEIGESSNYWLFREVAGGSIWL